jgi:hypothetical protein
MPALIFLVLVLGAMVVIEEIFKAKHGPKDINRRK